jgi:hypothetical protein
MDFIEHLDEAGLLSCLASFTTRIHLHIASKVSLVPVIFLCHGLVFKEVKWVQTRDDIVLT